MGLYGVTVEDGETNFSSLVTDIPIFDFTRRHWDYVEFA
jgi:hypothetical protein